MSTVKKLTSTVKSVYVASRLVNSLPTLVSKALEQNGYSGIKVEEIKIQKDEAGKFVLAEEMLPKIPEMEYLYTEPHFVGQIFCHPGSQIKWAQSTMAGCNTFFDEIKEMQIKRKPDFLMTRRDDGFSTMMGEYVIGHIIATERNFSLAYDRQKALKFDQSVLKQYRLLDTLTVGIIGLGAIGSKVAQLCKGMGMKVLGVVRDERFSTCEPDDYKHVDEISPLSKLQSVLESCNYIVTVLPNTPETMNLLSGNVLQACSNKKTVFINVGRGNVIDDDSLVNAVKKGWLGGAVLDVFNEEPLPPSNPLWTLPGVVVTPHVSAVHLQTVEYATGSFIHNLNALRDGKPFKSIVDFNKGY